MAKKRYVTLQIIPDDSTETWTFRLRYIFFEFLFYAGVIALLAMAIASVRVTQINAKLIAANHLADENKNLIERQKKMLLLEEEMGRIAEREKAIRSLLQAFAAEDTVISQEPNHVSVIPDLGKYLAKVRDLEKQIRGSRAGTLRDHVPDIWPVAGIVSRGFTQSQQPDLNHEALDIVAAENALVVTSAKGIVIASGLDKDLGRYVRVDHDFGIETVYGHLSQSLVQAGDHLEKGTALGLVGNTGNSLGPHLHYEIIFKGQAVDPTKYLH
jgi:murein DD-endopeptidase MepM/ murein hydrolase activator NlpD